MDKCTLPAGYEVLCKKVLTLTLIIDVPSYLLPVRPSVRQQVHRHAIVVSPSVDKAASRPRASRPRASGLGPHSLFNFLPSVTKVKVGRSVIGFEGEGDFLLVLESV